MANLPLDPMILNPVTPAEQLLVQQQQELIMQQQQMAMMNQTLAQIQARMNTRPIDKPAKPSTFDGMALNKARTWLAEMEQYFKVINAVDELYKVNFAAAHLRGHAAEWWITISPTDLQVQQAAVDPSMNIVNTWARFKEAFLKNYNPIPVKESAIYSLYRLKQDGGIQDYVNKFRYWAQLLGDSLSEEMKIFFLS